MGGVADDGVFAEEFAGVGDCDVSGAEVDAVGLAEGCDVEAVVYDEEGAVAVCDFSEGAGFIEEVTVWGLPGTVLHAADAADEGGFDDKFDRTVAAAFVVCDEADFYFVDLRFHGLTLRIAAGEGRGFGLNTKFPARPVTATKREFTWIFRMGRINKRTEAAA